MALPALLGPLIGLVKGGVTAFADHQAAKLQAKRAKALAVITKEGDWEKSMEDASNNSWKDEFWTIVLAFPLFVIFYGALTDDVDLINRVQIAFNVLAQTPEWYRWALGAAIGAAFAVRKIIPMIGKGK